MEHMDAKRFAKVMLALGFSDVQIDDLNIVITCSPDVNLRSRARKNAIMAALDGWSSEYISVLVEAIVSEQASV